MKTKHFLMGITAALLLCSGCEKEKDLPYLNILAVGDRGISYSPPEILANGGTYTISIGSNVAWTAKIDAAATWCGILSSNTATGVIIEDPYNHSSGSLQQGLVTISATMIPYTATEGRTTTLTLTSADISTTYTINQIPGIRMKTVYGKNEIWARTNVDEFGTFAENPASFGKFYQFNRTIAYDPTEPVDGIPPNWPDTYISENSNWLPENDPCPPGWQIPVNSFDLYGLFHDVYVISHMIDAYHSWLDIYYKWITSGDSFWTSYEDGTPMVGFLCGFEMESATWNDMKDCFFLPAVSGRNETGQFDARNFYVQGFYWTRNGTITTNNYGDVLGFSNHEDDIGGVRIIGMQKHKGSALPIRCVKK